MASRRGRLNWSNLEVHISDDVIEKQHRFTVPKSLSSTSISTDNIVEYEKETSSLPSPPPPIKRTWMPKMGVGEMHVEQFGGNVMLTSTSNKL